MDTRNSLHPDQPLGRQVSLDFELLYLLKTEPCLTQREIAERLGVSLGRANYCLKALIERGVLKLANVRSPKRKFGYVYMLTPKGITERVALTGHFLQRKLAEYERLEAQIHSLQCDLALRREREDL